MEDGIHLVKSTKTREDQEGARKGGTAWSFSMMAAKALKQYCFHAQNKIAQHSPPRQHRSKTGSLFHQKAVKLWFVPHLLLPEWFREGMVQL